MPDLFFCFIPQIVFLRGIIFSKFAKKCKHLALLARCMSACGRASVWASERACERGCDKALFFIAFRERTWPKKRYGHYLTNEWTYERTSGQTNWQTNKREMITWSNFTWSKLSFFTWSKVLINILSLDQIFLRLFSWSKVLIMVF